MLGGGRHDDCDSALSPPFPAELLRRPGEFKLCATLPNDNCGEINESAPGLMTGGSAGDGSVDDRDAVCFSFPALYVKEPTAALKAGSKDR